MRVGLLGTRSRTTRWIPAAWVTVDALSASLRRFGGFESSVRVLY